MANLRSKSKKSKTKAAGPRAASKRKKQATPTPAPSPSDPGINETALRELSRSELQKLAMTLKVKANMKSEHIIRELLKKRAAEDGPEEGPSRKKLKRSAVPEKDPNQRENQAAPRQGDSSHHSAEIPQLSEDGLSVPLSGKQTTPTLLSYDNDLFSGTESEATEEEQLDYATPVSSRAETPPPANVNDLKHCVTIMQELSAKDVRLMLEVADVRGTATKLHKKARNVRDLVKAERARRERMEAYFRYWQEIEPNWDREWVYGDQEVAPHDDSNGAAGPSRIPGGHGAQQPASAVHGRNPPLSPEEVWARRQAIVAKQQAEQRQLEALERAKRRNETFSGESHDSADEGSVGDADLPSTQNQDVQVNGPLMISLESNAEADTRPGPSL